MDGIKYAVFTDKSIRLLSKNQYTSNVESGSTRTEIKHWGERRELNPRMVDSQSTALIHLATSAPHLLVPSSAIHDFSFFFLKYNYR